VYVLVPPHGGSGLTTGADGVIVRLQLSVIVGGVGATAAAGQATVTDPSEGIVIVGRLIVIVCKQVEVLPQASLAWYFLNIVYISVQIWFPIESTNHVMVGCTLQLSVTDPPAATNEA
jgi:hypothetical protein